MWPKMMRRVKSKSSLWLVTLVLKSTLLFALNASTFNTYCSNKKVAAMNDFAGYILTLMPKDDSKVLSAFGN